MKIFNLRQINLNYPLSIMRANVKRGYVFWDKYIGDNWIVIFRLKDWVLARKYKGE
jgi:hypothetical protein